MTLSLPTRGIDLEGTLRTLAILPGDPCVSLQPGRLIRATITPEGPGTITATWRSGGERVDIATVGDGARWLTDRAAQLVGIDDDVATFTPGTDPVRTLWRRHQGLRIARTSTVWHDLSWLIVQQRVRVNDAANHWRRLVRALGNPAPGAPTLLTPPDPASLRHLAYHDLHRHGLERRRSEHLLAAARYADRLHPLAERAFEDARPILESIRGIGPWTISCASAFTWGNPDTVISGDAGIPSLVAWVLAREPRADDARLVELLEPHRPHRYRVIKLAFAAGLRPPSSPPFRRRPA